MVAAKVACSAVPWVDQMAVLLVEQTAGLMAVSLVGMKAGHWVAQLGRRSAGLSVVNLAAYWAAVLVAASAAKRAG